MGFFDPFLKDAWRSASTDVIAAFVRAHAMLFTAVQLQNFDRTLSEFSTLLEERIKETSIDFRQQGYCIAISNCIALHEYQPTDSYLSKLISMDAVSTSEKALTGGTSAISTIPQSFE